MTDLASFPEILLSSLLKRQDYFTAVAAYVKVEYFGEATKEGVLLEEILKFNTAFSGVPTLSILRHAVQKRENLNQNLFVEINHTAEKLFARECDENLQWLIEETETFCQDKAIYNAVVNSIDILDGKHKNLTKHAIPELLSKALGVSFDASLGHNYLEDSEQRYGFYHDVLNKIPFDLEYFNLITDGGMSKGELMCLVGGTGTGKTLVMNHMASANLMMGKNVLYVSMEMSDKSIGARIDQNLFDMKREDIKLLTKDRYIQKVRDLHAKTIGKLVIRQYPTSSASSAHFKFLMEELKTKENFIPDVVYIDYINICASSRIKSSENSYSFIKAIAEELRGIAVEYNVALVTCAQVNRGGQGASNLELKDIAESAGLSHTADLLLALIVTDDLEELGRMQVKQLKNRNAAKQINRIFDIGCDREKMRLFDLAPASQNSPVGSVPSTNYSPARVFGQQKTITNSRTEGNNDGWKF